MKKSLKWKLAQRVEIMWWRNYFKGKNKIDYLAWKQNYWEDFLQKTGIELEVGKSILDAGCGPAGIFTILHGHQVTAVDPLIPKYSELSFFHPHQYPYTTFVSSPLETFDQGSFHYIFCVNVINHVNDPGKVLQNFRKMLKPEGKLILSVDAHRSSFLKKAFQLLPGDILHPHQLQWKDYVELLQENGFTFKREVLLKEEKIFDYWVAVLGHYISNGLR